MTKVAERVQQLSRSDQRMADPRLSAIWSHRGQMQRLALHVVLEHAADGMIPTNGRFVFYELEQASYVRKSSPDDRNRRGGAVDPREQDVTDALMFLREAGVIPWDWIEDETRRLDVFDGAPSVLDYVLDDLEYATIDPWRGAPPLILCESRSLSGVLRSLAAEYRCAVAATNGQVGGFLRTKVAPLLRGNDRPVLYLGDLDWQGDQIEANTRRVLEQEAGRRIDWTRIAITQQQVTEHQPPLEPAWKKDERYKPAKWYEAVETEALGQAEITRIARSELDARLPEPLSNVLAREQEQREEIEQILAEHLPE
jgi:hypothetical protein